MALLQLHEKRAMFFVGVIILTCGAVAGDPAVATCTSTICQEVGAEITSNIDSTVDACTDFFQHACGGWIVKHPVTSSASMSHQFDRVESKVVRDLKDLLEKDEGEPGGAIRKARDFYKSCVDQATIERSGLQPLTAILTANGDWPLTVPSASWNPQQFTWQQIHEKFMNVTELSALFGLIVAVNHNNPSEQVITLGSMFTSADQERISSSRKREAMHSYDNFVLNVALKLTELRGLNVPAADVEADVTTLLAFMAELRKNLTQSSDESKYRIITIKQAQNIWNAAVNNNAQYEVNWLETIKKIFEGTGIVIDENEKLAVTPGDFLQRLATLLSKTPIRTIVNYIHWYAINNLLPHFNKVMRELLLSPNVTETLGTTEYLERWRTCSLYHEMPHAVSFMYGKTHFTAQSRTSVTEMIQHVREAIKQKISNSTWMDQNARTLTKGKIDAMNNKIGYPDWYDVPGKIDQYYNDLTVGSNYFENVLAVTRFNKKKLLRKLRYSDEPRWGMDATEVNAEYVESSNSLTFPAGIFQMPIYHHEQPSALRFGGIGTIIAQQISHGFLNTGEIFEDTDGNKHQWWSNATIAAYKEKLQCIVNQYSQYQIATNPFTDEPIYVNGQKTLDATVPDHVGLSMAFRAYQQYKNLHPNEMRIPALNDISDDKLYFYGLASIFCADVQPGFLAFVYPSIPFPPNKVRVNGALSNMREFADTFGCAAGSQMNPTNKCVLWG